MNYANIAATLIEAGVSFPAHADATDLVRSAVHQEMDRAQEADAADNAFAIIMATNDVTAA